MRISRTAGWLLLGLILAATLIVSLPGASYSKQDRTSIFAGASRSHPVGTDGLGRDRMIRVSAALLLSLGGAVAASALSTAAAAGVGALAAFGPSTLGWLVLLVCDVFLALPWLFLLMLVRSALPLTTSPANGAAITFLILAALGWPACARTVYHGARNLRYADWMLQSHAAGLRPRQTIRCAIPNLMPVILPQFLVSIPAFVMAEANLGALGLGVGEPLPSWGGMLLELDNSAMLLETRWVYLPIAILITVLLLIEAIAAEV